MPLIYTILIVTVLSFLIFLGTIVALYKTGKFHSLHPRWMIPLSILGGPIFWCVCLAAFLEIIATKYDEK